jgi:hypothetical protein
MPLRCVCTRSFSDFGLWIFDCGFFVETNTLTKNPQSEIENPKSFKLPLPTPL